jgi:hypothetical protein
MTSDEQYVAKQQVLAAFEHGCSVQNLLSTTSIPLHRATLYRLRQRLQTDPETVLSDGRHGPEAAGGTLPSRCTSAPWPSASSNWDPITPTRRAASTI